MERRLGEPQNRIGRGGERKIKHKVVDGVYNEDRIFCANTQTCVYVRMYIGMCIQMFVQLQAHLK
jgi:hypothetical protein